MNCSREWAGGAGNGESGEIARDSAFGIRHSGSGKVCEGPGGRVADPEARGALLKPGRAGHEQ